jgi:murein DD-endopeptidase MepM/ murein hydrolase activator NlpD
LKNKILRIIIYIFVYIGTSSLLVIHFGAASLTEPTVSFSANGINLLQGDTVESVEQAILQELSARRETFVYSAFYTQIENISISQDENYASAWMMLIDPVTLQAIPTEPGLALLEWVGNSWSVALPGDPEWENRLDSAPSSLISPEDKAFWQLINLASTAMVPDAPISGYFLPWEGGRTAYLSGSVSHDAYIPSGNAHYAFDFYVPGVSSSVMFDLYAARAGTVWMFRDSQPNHSEDSPGNYLVLRDTTTNPTTYQLYLHLAQNSIPSQLKAIGALVVQGQYIGVADDTGFSTGNHLHFHVHTEPNSYWGRSVDITFDDVTINGGRPRVQNQFYNDQIYCKWPGDVCEKFQSAYVSGNRRLAAVSALNKLDPVQKSTAFRISWISQPGASPIDHFELQQRVGLGDWQNINTNIPGNQSSLWLVVDPEQIYAYRLRAVDVVGRVEDYPFEAETLTYVPPGSDLCIVNDIYEIDNSPESATTFMIGMESQTHIFCGTPAGNYIDDQDWIRIPGVMGETFHVLVVPDHQSVADPKITLFSRSGDVLNEIKQRNSPGISVPVWLDHTPLTNSDFYVQIRSQNGKIFGSGTGYKLYVLSDPPNNVLIPVIFR